jgi:hypothetical protein
MRIALCKRGHPRLPSESRSRQACSPAFLSLNGISGERSIRAPDSRAGRCIQALTRRSERLGTSGAWPMGTQARTVPTEAMSASGWTTVQGKPGVSRGRKARDLPSGRPPGCRSPSGKLEPSRWCREGEPGALHRGCVAPCDDGPLARRGTQVELTGFTPVAATAVPHQAAHRPGPSTGLRWD